MRLARTVCIALTSFLFIALAARSFTQADQADVDAILAGISEIRIGGSVPGPVCTFGDDAFVVLQGSSGPNKLPAIAAARYGDGRAVAGGHESLLNAPPVEGEPMFAVDAVRWAGGKEAPRVALYKQGGLAGPLIDAGMESAEVSAEDLVGGLAGFDVLVTTGYHFDAPEAVGQLDAIEAFVRDGGGLVTAICPWGWKYYDPEKNIATDLGMNRVLEKMGIVWSDGHLGATVEGAYSTEIDISPLTHAKNALDALVGHATGEQQLTDEDLRQAGVTLSRSALAIPPDNSTFLPKLLDVTAKHGGDEYPTPDEPVKTQNPFARLSATFYLSKSKALPADQITAHPAADAFPGAVPPDAERVTTSLTIDTSTPAWHSTGLYAAPGDLITVTVPADAAGKGLSLRVGCHTDGLWGKDQWKRFPEITRSAAVAEATAKIANPFGGLVYVDVPRDCELGEIEVEISGGVLAPHYVHGQTNLGKWRDAIRGYPAPWAELEGQNVILTVPSDVIRELEDPESLVAFWDHALDCQADLAGMSRDRERPERIVADVQISAGYMHSGYPIMTWLDAPARAVDLEALTTEGSWGHFHELGHNHQSGHWTFGGTGEVTCNLFTVYVHETACHLPTAGHPALKPEEVEKKHREYFAAGAPFDKWKRDPFLALSMYLQIREAFGWQPFRSVFASYRNDPEDKLPKNDDEKRDQFMVRMSREIGRNLGPFFEAWGVPTSEEARASIADLPEWMPEDFPPAG